jgi:hypothetical protein
MNLNYYGLYNKVGETSQIIGNKLLLSLGTGI